MDLPYEDRHHAGAVLAYRLAHLAGRPDLDVLALPRGGVPVAYEVAKALKAPLDVFVVRKLGAPMHQEYAMGALASGGEIVLNQEAIQELGITEEEISKAAEREQEELIRREHLYRGNRPPLDLQGRTVVLVDDGLATGSTMRAAVRAIRLQQPSRLVVAVPVAPLEACEELRGEVDEIVCVETPEPFMAVGYWYRDFQQTTDEEVRALLGRAQAWAPGWTVDESQPSAP